MLYAVLFIDGVFIIRELAPPSPTYIIIIVRLVCDCCETIPSHVIAATLAEVRTTLTEVRQHLLHNACFNSTSQIISAGYNFIDNRRSMIIRFTISLMVFQVRSVECQ